MLVRYCTAVALKRHERVNAFNLVRSETHPIRIATRLVIGRPKWWFFFGRWFTADIFCPSMSLGRSLWNCHMIGNWVRFITQVPKFGGTHQKYFGPRTCKISGDFIQLQTLIANILGTSKDKDVQNRKEMWSRAIPPAFHESLMNFGSQTK